MNMDRVEQCVARLNDIKTDVEDNGKKMPMDVLQYYDSGMGSMLCIIHAVEKSLLKAGLSYKKKDGERLV